MEVFTAAQRKNPQKEYFTPFLVEDGRELLLFDNNTSTIHRYGMP